MSMSVGLTTPSMIPVKVMLLVPAFPPASFVVTPRFAAGDPGGVTAIAPPLVLHR
jgi:hypothetical protein